MALRCMAIFKPYETGGSMVLPGGSPKDNSTVGFPASAAS